MPSTLNVLEGPSRFFVGTASSDVLPGDAVALGGSWGGTWRDFGYLTEEGVTITFNQTFNPVMSSQDRNPILQLPGATNDTIACTLTEATLLNIKTATGRGTITSLAPVGATPGYDNLALSQSTSINYVALGFEGIAPPNNKSNPRRILFPKAMATASVAINQRIGQPVGIPAQFARVGGTGNDPQIHDVTTT